MEGILIILLSICSCFATYDRDATEMRHECNETGDTSATVFAVHEKTGLPGFTLGIITLDNISRNLPIPLTLCF